MSYLILVRHGQTDYNAQGLWTGWSDSARLDEKGVEEAKLASEALKGLPLDFAYTSDLSRAKQTLEIIKQTLNLQDIPTFESQALRERNYGIYTGKNKWDVKKQVGEEEFQKIRRGWNYSIPAGESLKQVYERVLPYFIYQILPNLKRGKNVIISSSGNCLRALVKYLERISDQDISSLEIGLGEVYVYQIDNNGQVVTKEIKNTNPKTGKI